MSISRTAYRETPQNIGPILYEVGTKILKNFTKFRLHILHNNREIMIIMHSYNPRLSFTAHLMSTFQRI